MAECYRGVTPRGSVRSLDRTDVYCSKIYRRPACARAWLDLSIAYTTPRQPTDTFDGKSFVVSVVDRCRKDYCVVATGEKPALCSSASELTKAEFTAFVKWLVEQELTIPDERSEHWANSFYLGAWLQ
jgi:hypothetical protein